MAEKFEGQFECLEENNENYLTFSVLIKEENKNGKTITYNIKFIDCVRFMASLHSSLADNLTKVLHKDKYKDCKSDVRYVAAKGSIVTFNCVNCNESYEKEFSEDLAKRFENTYKFCDEGINKFCLVLQKVVYPYQYIDCW